MILLKLYDAELLYLKKKLKMALAGLKIGHTKLTHGFLMEGGNPPFCEECVVPLTMKHILIECPSLEEHRDLFGFTGPPTLTTVFKPYNTDFNGPLYAYLRRIRILNKI